MKTFKTSLASTLIASVALLTIRPAGADVDISLRMANRLRSDKGYEWAFREYMDAKRLGKVKKFLSHPFLKDYNNQFEKQMRPYIQDYAVFNVAAYLNYKKNYADLGRILNTYYFDKMIVLQEISENPRLTNVSYKMGSASSANPAEEAKKILASIDAMAGQGRYAERPGSGMGVLAQKLSSCVGSIHTNLAEAQRYDLLKRCILINLPKLNASVFAKVPDQSFAALDIEVIDPVSAGAPLSKAGFTPGNAVSMLNRNQTAQSTRMEKIYAASFEKIINPMKLRWAKRNGQEVSNQQMISEMRTIIRQAEASGKHPMHTVFDATDDVIYSDSEGSVTKKDMWTGDKHPQFKNYGPEAEHSLQTFAGIANAIRSAKSSIFIDMFFFGGTTSAAIGELVIAQLKANPNVKAVLLHDELNAFDLADQIRPVWNFMRAYMAEHPDRLLAVPANVYQKKVLGIPDIVGRKLDSSYFVSIGLSQQLQNLKGTADHSKVVVIDGDVFDKPATAIVGSKNWADSSGALSNDETTRFVGPHAHVVLDEFYDDLFHGIRYDWEKKGTGALWEEVFQKGFAQTGDCKNAPAGNMEQKITRMLCPVDLLKRYKTSLTSEKDVDKLISSGAVGKIMAKEGGKSFLRSGGHNWDGTFRSALNQDLEVIYRAKKQILISEQYVAQPHIVRALVEKAQNGVDVAIVMEGFTKLDPPGFPNILYLEKLKDAGVKARFKKHAPSAWFPGEFHGKTLSIDGWNANGEPLHTTSNPPILIIGSANKDFMTLTGAFREAQVEIQDPTASKQHDQNFWRYYKSDAESYPASLDAFSASKVGQKINAQGISTEDFMEYTRWLMSILYQYRVVH